MHGSHLRRSIWYHYYVMGNCSTLKQLQLLNTFYKLFIAFFSLMAYMFHTDYTPGVLCLNRVPLRKHWWMNVSDAFYRLLQPDTFHRSCSVNQSLPCPVRTLCIPNTYSVYTLPIPTNLLPNNFELDQVWLCPTIVFHKMTVILYSRSSNFVDTIWVGQFTTA